MKKNTHRPRLLCHPWRLASDFFFIIFIQNLFNDTFFLTMCSCDKVVAKKEENQNWRAFKNTLSLTSTRPRNERGRVDTHDHLVTFLSTSISRLNSVDAKTSMDFFLHSTFFK